MDIQQLKLYIINASTLSVTTFTRIEMGLKMLLLIVTIGYTVSKWVGLKKKKMIDRIIGGPAKKKTTCWKGYSNIVNGKPQFKKKGEKMVPDCKPTKKEITMSVLNKLKSRMSSYRGPTQVDPTKSSPVYGFDTGRARNSGVDAVNAGLAAGYNQAPVVSNVGQQIADAGSNIGSALGAMGKSKRSESISKSKEAGKTGMEARAQWKKEKSDDLAARGKKAVDEGRDKKADRLLNRAAKNEDRSIELEEKAYFKKHGKRKPVEVTSLEPEGIAPILRSMPVGTNNEEEEEEEEKFGARFGNAPIIDENLI